MATDARPDGQNDRQFCISYPWILIVVTGYRGGEPTRANASRLFGYGKAPVAAEGRPSAGSLDMDVGHLGGLGGIAARSSSVLWTTMSPVATGEPRARPRTAVPGDVSADTLIDLVEPEFHFEVEGRD